MKIIEILKKYKLYIISAFLVITFFRSCGKSRSIYKLEKASIESSEAIDSLNILLGTKQAKIDSIPDIIRNEKLSIHLMYNDTISKLDRTPQTMWLQKNVTLPSIRGLQK